MNTILPSHPAIAAPSAPVSLSRDEEGLLSREGCGIYGLRNKIDGKWYIGQSVNIGWRKYLHFWHLKRGNHRNHHLQSAFLKHGTDCFEFHLLERVPEDMLDIRERAWIARCNSANREHGYNLDAGNGANRQRSEETLRKISLAHTGLRYSAESRLKMSLAKKGKPHPHSLETRRKLSLALKGKPGCPHSPESRLKVSLALKGHPVSAETRQKISKANKGRIISLEWRRNIVLAIKNRPPVSAETRLKMSIAQRARRSRKSTL